MQIANLSSGQNMSRFSPLAEHACQNRLGQELHRHTGWKRGRGMRYEPSLHYISFIQWWEGTMPQCHFRTHALLSQHSNRFILNWWARADDPTAVDISALWLWSWVIPTLFENQKAILRVVCKQEDDVPWNEGFSRGVTQIRALYRSSETSLHIKYIVY